jgi:hypothetical protein
VTLLRNQSGTPRHRSCNGKTLFPSWFIVALHVRCSPNPEAPLFCCSHGYNPTFRKGCMRKAGASCDLKKRITCRSAETPRLPCRDESRSRGACCSPSQLRSRLESIGSSSASPGPSPQSIIDQVFPNVVGGKSNLGERLMAEALAQGFALSRRLALRLLRSNKSSSGIHG